MAVWYDDSPTVISKGGTVTFIQFKDDELPNDESSQEWVKRAQECDEWPEIVTRAAVARMLEGVDEKAVTEARLDPATTDIAALALGTAEEKEKAVAEKLAAVVSVAEWEKLEALQATVIRNEKPPEDEKP